MTRHYVALPSKVDRSLMTWVDVEEIIAIQEVNDGSHVHLLHLDLPVFTVLDGRAIFNQILDDNVSVTQ